MRNRAAKTAAALSSPATSPAAAPAPPKKKVTVAQFFREVRAEGRKITWTSRKETWITSVMVAIMVVLASIFFLGVDWIINSALSLFLQFANRG